MLVRFVSLIAVAWMLAACADLPADAEGSSESNLDDGETVSWIWDGQKVDLTIPKTGSASISAPGYDCKIVEGVRGLESRKRLLSCRRYDRMAQRFLDREALFTLDVASSGTAVLADVDAAGLLQAHQVMGSSSVLYKIGLRCTSSETENSTTYACLPSTSMPPDVAVYNAVPSFEDALAGAWLPFAGAGGESIMERFLQQWRPGSYRGKNASGGDCGFEVSLTERAFGRDAVRIFEIFLHAGGGGFVKLDAGLGSSRMFGEAATDGRTYAFEDTLGFRAVFEPGRVGFIQKNEATGSFEAFQPCSLDKTP